MVEEDEIERALIEEVQRADLDLATTNSIRKKVEEQLKLDPGFLKSAGWKDRSKELINQTLAECIQRQDEHQQDVREEEKGAGDVNYDENVNKDETGDGSEREENRTDDEIDKDAEKEPQPPKAPPKKRKTPTASEKKVVKAPKMASAKSTKDRSTEISKLKGQLMKCGVRKQWNKLLDPLPTDAAKVNYLKEQLAEVGITGRFSLKKAEQVKEKRELEELQREAASYLGGSGSEEPEGRSNRRKRVVNDEEEDDD